jgi:hypothetical protein
VGCNPNVLLEDSKIIIAQFKLSSDIDEDNVIL